MYLALTDEQDFLREAAAGALARHATVARARAALDGEDVSSLWPVAAEAGWPGLLIGEDADGAGLGAYEALLVLEQCGRLLADARLLGHLPATALLEAAGSPLRAALASGARRAALVDGALGERDRPLAATTDPSAPASAALSDPPAPASAALSGRSAPASAALSGRSAPASAGLSGRSAPASAALSGRSAPAYRFEGTVRGVLDAAGADLLVLVGEEADGNVVVGVVDAAAGGVGITAQRAYDGTRAMATVELDGVRAAPLDVPGVRVGRDLQRALLAAEAVGAADACLAMARGYAVDRMAFGRPIGSYQAIKHKLVEMLRLIEDARSLLLFAGRSWGSPEFALAASAARVAATEALDYAAPENIFIHGGVGATWEHDAMLYYRRAEHARRLAGGADAAAEAVAAALLEGDAHARA